MIRPEDKVRDGKVRYFDIFLTGVNGEVECNRDAALTVTVEGGELLAFGSANPRTEESYLTGTFRTWYGKSQAVVLPKEQTLRVTVSEEGLKPVSTTVELA